MIRRKAEQASATARFDFDCVSKRATWPDSFKDPFQLPPEKVGQADCRSQNRTSEERLPPIAPNPIGDGDGSWHIEHAAVSKLKEKLIGSRRLTRQAVDG